MSSFPSPFNTKRILKKEDRKERTFDVSLIVNSTANSTRNRTTTNKDKPEDLVNWIDNIDLRVKKLLEDQQNESRHLKEQTRVDELKTKYQNTIFDDQFNKLDGLLGINTLQKPYEPQKENKDVLDESDDDLIILGSEEDADVGVNDDQYQEYSDDDDEEQEQYDEDEIEEDVPEVIEHDEDEIEEDVPEVIEYDEEEDEIEVQSLDDEENIESDQQVEEDEDEDLEEEPAEDFGRYSIPQNQYLQTPTTHASFKVQDGRPRLLNPQISTNYEHEVQESDEEPEEYEEEDGQENYYNEDEVLNEPQARYRKELQEEELEALDSEEKHYDNVAEEELGAPAEIKSQNQWGSSAPDDDSIIVLDSEEEEVEENLQDEIEEEIDRELDEELEDEDDDEEEESDENEDYGGQYQQNTHSNADYQMYFDSLQPEAKGVEVGNEDIEEKYIESENDDNEVDEDSEENLDDDQEEGSESETSDTKYPAYNPETNFFDNNQLLQLAEAVLKENVAESSDVPKSDYLADNELTDSRPTVLTEEPIKVEEAIAPIPDAFYEEISHDHIELVDNDDNRSDGSLADQETDRETLKEIREHETKEPKSSSPPIPIFKTVEEEDPETTLEKLKETERKFHVKFNSVIALENELNIKSSPLSSRPGSTDPFNEEINQEIPNHFDLTYIEVPHLDTIVDETFDEENSDGMDDILVEDDEIQVIDPEIDEESDLETGAHQDEKPAEYNEFEPSSMEPEERYQELIQEPILEPLLDPMRETFDETFDEASEVVDETMDESQEGSANVSAEHKQVHEQVFSEQIEESVYTYKELPNEAVKLQDNTLDPINLLERVNPVPINENADVEMADDLIPGPPEDLVVENSTEEVYHGAQPLEENEIIVEEEVIEISEKDIEEVSKEPLIAQQRSDELESIEIDMDHGNDETASEPDVNAMVPEETQGTEADIIEEVIQPNERPTLERIEVPELEDIPDYSDDMEGIEEETLENSSTPPLIEEFIEQANEVTRFEHIGPTSVVEVVTEEIIEIHAGSLDIIEVDTEEVGVQPTSIVISGEEEQSPDILTSDLEPQNEGQNEELAETKPNSDSDSSSQKDDNKKVESEIEIQLAEESDGYHNSDEPEYLIDQTIEVEDDYEVQNGQEDETDNEILFVLRETGLVSSERSGEQHLEGEESDIRETVQIDYDVVDEDELIDEEKIPADESNQDVDQINQDNEIVEETEQLTEVYELYHPLQESGTPGEIQEIQEVQEDLEDQGQRTVLQEFQEILQENNEEAPESQDEALHVSSQDEATQEIIHGIDDIQEATPQAEEIEDELVIQDEDDIQEETLHIELQEVAKAEDQMRQLGNIAKTDDSEAELEIEHDNPVLGEAADENLEEESQKHHENYEIDLDGPREFIQLVDDLELVTDKVDNHSEVEAVGEATVEGGSNTVSGSELNSRKRSRDDENSSSSLKRVKRFVSALNPIKWFVSSKPASIPSETETNPIIEVDELEVNIDLDPVNEDLELELEEIKQEEQEEEEEEDEEAVIENVQEPTEQEVEADISEEELDADTIHPDNVNSDIESEEESEGESKPKVKKVLGLEITEEPLEPRKSLRSGHTFGTPETGSPKKRTRSRALDLPKQREALATEGFASEPTPRKVSGRGGWRLDELTDHPALRTRSKSPLKRSLKEILSSDLEEETPRRRTRRGKKGEEAEEEPRRGRSARR